MHMCILYTENYGFYVFKYFYFYLVNSQIMIVKSENRIKELSVF